MDRFDAHNLAIVAQALGDGIMEQVESLPHNEEGEALALRDYASQLWSTAETLRDSARSGQPIDWADLSNSLGMDVVLPGVL